MKLEPRLNFYPGDRGEFLRVDESACTGCGKCRDFCACGACWNICPAEAVQFDEPCGGTGVVFTYG